MVVLAGNDKDLHPSAAVEDLARGEGLEAGHGQTLVLPAGCGMQAPPAPDAAAVRLLIHILVHRQVVIFNPAICLKTHKKISVLFYQLTLECNFRALTVRLTHVHSYQSSLLR